MSTPLRVLILAFDEVEALDFAGPFEVFTTASRVHARQHPGQAPLFDVKSVAAQGMVKARAGLQLIADHSLADAPRADVLVVPGGVVAGAMQSIETLAWIAAQSRAARITASVCTGAFLLARIGLLKGRTVTTHWEDIPELRAAHPDLTVVEDVPYVDEGRIVTSAGISAGIDMSLHLVARILGAAPAQATARQMQYDWSEARAAA